MRKHFDFRKLAGMVVSAATLLALAAPFGAAQASEPTIAVPTDGTETLTVNGDFKAMDGHSFKAVRIGGYTDAEADSAPNTLKSVSVETVDAVKSGAESALTAAGAKAEAAYKGNPVGQVAGDWLGYGGSKGDNTSAQSPWTGKLRNFVTDLVKEKDFVQLQDTAESASAGAAQDAAGQDDKDAAKGTVVFSKLVPGIYVVVDVTADAPAAQGDAGEAGVNVTAEKNSIPMLTGTGITVGGQTYSSLAGSKDAKAQTLGQVGFKSDGPSVEKELVGATSATIGGELSYKLTSRVPVTTGYDPGAYVFKIIDTPSAGLAFDQSSLVYNLKVGSKAAADYKNNDELVKGVATVTDATGDDRKGDTQNVVFDLTKVLPQLNFNDPIVITYKMKVTSNAKTELSNSATVTSSGPVDQVESAPAAAQPAYLRHFDLLSVDKGNKNKRLKGAQFKIKIESGKGLAATQASGSAPSGVAAVSPLFKGATQAASSNDYLKFSEIDDGDYTVAGTGTVTGNDAADTDVITVCKKNIRTGSLDVFGLADDTTYSVEEVTRPDAYPNTPLVKFTVSVSGSKGDSATDVYRNTGDSMNLDLVSEHQADTDPEVDPIDIYAITSLGQLPMTGNIWIILAIIVVLLLLIAVGILAAIRRHKSQDALVL